MMPPELIQKQAELFAKSRKARLRATKEMESYMDSTGDSFSEKDRVYFEEKAFREEEGLPTIKDQLLELSEKPIERYGHDKSTNEKGTAKASSTKNQVAKEEEQPGKEKGRTDSKGHRPRTPEQAQRQLKFISPVTEANMRANDRPYVPGHEPAYPP
ncbi:MAG: hypothetical protein Q9174_006113 [Haloplaca sp. 1 TL-2023]